MANPFFRWVDCTDKRRPHDLQRTPQTALRIAQMTDPHVPGEISLAGRLRDLVRPHRAVGNISHHLSAIANEMSHAYRKSEARRVYLNLLKKTCIGLRRIGVDHLVITGDLTHCGLEAEFVDIRAVLETTGWLSPERLTVIAGNHDRFNLYERFPGAPMEHFFDVVDGRTPRLKELPGGVVLLEIDSNRDPADDRHFSERWLPNTVGRIYPETLDWIAAHQSEIGDRRLVVLVHHHLTGDWYPRKATSRAEFGLMDPLEEADDLAEAAALADERAIFLHGHKHDVMDVDYHFGDHRLGNPGGFASSLRLNLLDFDAHGAETMIQIELRT
jgi:3',5'-cyclic AMP phosphodiesterase CpdA